MPGTSTATITISLRFLARYAELAGRDGAVLELPQGSTVADAIAFLRDDPALGPSLPPKPLCALNFRQVRGDQPLAEGDELALLPPLAGG